MIVSGIDIDEAIKNMQAQLAADKNVTQALKTSINFLIMIDIMIKRLTLNSSSSNPLSLTDKFTRRKVVSGKKKRGHLPFSSLSNIFHEQV